MLSDCNYSLVLPVLLATLMLAKFGLANQGKTFTLDNQDTLKSEMAAQILVESRLARTPKPHSEFQANEVDSYSNSNHQSETADLFAGPFDGSQMSKAAASGGINSGQHDSDYFYQEQPGGHIDQTFDNSFSINHIQNNNNDNIMLRHQHPHRRLEKEYLSHDIAEKACRLDRGCPRRDRLNNTYLSFCSRYKLETLFSTDILMSIMHDTIEECDRILDEFIQLDETISQFDSMFRNLLTRYNCHNGYSVKWSCDDCKKAYKDWLCATSLPYYMNAERVKPCISFCERVEQRCPYLHPISKEQYGGQPVFICRDPNIPFVPEITPDIPYSEPAKCYDLCHLSDNVTELITDSLSKYDYNKCPDKGSVAEEVRSDPFYCNLDSFQQQRQQKHQQQEQRHRQQQSIASKSRPHDLADTLSESNLTMSNHEGDESSTMILPTVHVHMKKLNELKEVITNYKNQPKTHKLGQYSEHGSHDEFMVASSYHK